MARDFYADAQFYKKLETGKPLLGDDLLLLTVGETLSGHTALVNALEYPLVTSGTWAGSTVPRVCVDMSILGRLVRVLDMPGAHGVSISEIEELARQDPDVDKCHVAILCVLNADALLRSLPFIIEMTELNVPIILGLRECQRAKQQGRMPNIELIRRVLGVPVLTDIGDRVLKAEEIAKLALETAPPSFTVRYNQSIEASVNEVVHELKYNTSRWLALSSVQGMQVTVPNNAQVKATQQNLKWRESGIDLTEAVVCTRMQISNGLIMESEKRNMKPSAAGIKLGKLLAKPFIGIPVIAILTVLLLHLTFGLARPWMGWLNTCASLLASFVSACGLPDVANSFVSRALIQGLGSFLSLAPLMFAFYFVIGLLEETGLVSCLGACFRSLCRMLGISELIVAPALQSLGCTIQGISAVRLLPTPGNQTRAALAMSFIPCAGRLGVLACLAAIFVPDKAAYAIVGIYLGGFVLAMLTVLLSRSLENKLMSTIPMDREIEVPPCHLPNLKLVMRTAAILTWNFYVTAILPVIVTVTIIWALIFVNKLETVMGCFAAIFKPLGLGDYRMVSTIFSGLIAKEAMLATAALSYLVNDPCPALSFAQCFKVLGTATTNALMGTLHAFTGYFSWEALLSSSNDVPIKLANKIAPMLKPAQSMALLVFTAFSAPCLAAWSALRRAAGGKYMLILVAIQTVVAWILALIVGKMF